MTTTAAAVVVVVVLDFVSAVMSRMTYRLGTVA
jgi:hypothetical protein